MTFISERTVCILGLFLLVMGEHAHTNTMQRGGLSTSLPKTPALNTPSSNWQTYLHLRSSSSSTLASVLAFFSGVAKTWNDHFTPRPPEVRSLKSGPVTRKSVRSLVKETSSDWTTSSTPLRGGQLEKMLEVIRYLQSKGLHIEIDDIDKQHTEKEIDEILNDIDPQLRLKAENLAAERFSSQTALGMNFFSRFSGGLSQNKSPIETSTKPSQNIILPRGILQLPSEKETKDISKIPTQLCALGEKNPFDDKLFKAAKFLKAVARCALTSTTPSSTPQSHHNECWACLTENGPALPCGHFTCKSCLHNQLSEAIARNNVDWVTTCQECNGSVPCRLPPANIAEAISTAEQHLRLQRLVLRTLNIKACPGCDETLITHNPYMEWRSHCQCGFNGCFNCAAPDGHDGSCSDLVQLAEIEESTLNLARNMEEINDSNEGLCPNCLVPFVRREGCDFIVCGKDFHADTSASLGCGKKFNIREGRETATKYIANPLAFRETLRLRLHPTSTTEDFRKNAMGAIARRDRNFLARNCGNSPRTLNFPIDQFNLHDVNFNSTKFESVDQVKAVLDQKGSLQGANLSKLPLMSLDFSDANLRETDFRGSNLRNCRFHGADLRGARLGREQVISVVDGWGSLAGTNLQGQNLTHLQLPYADFTGASLTQTQLTGANLTGALFANAMMRFTELTGATLKGINTFQTTFHKVVIDPEQENDIKSGNIFSGAQKEEEPPSRVITSFAELFRALRGPRTGDVLQVNGLNLAGLDLGHANLKGKFRFNAKELDLSTVLHLISCGIKFQRSDFERDLFTGLKLGNRDIFRLLQLDIIIPGLDPTAVANFLEWQDNISDKMLLTLLESGYQIRHENFERGRVFFHGHTFTTNQVLAVLDSTFRLSLRNGDLSQVDLRGITLTPKEVIILLNSGYIFNDGKTYPPLFFEGLHLIGNEPRLLAKYGFSLLRAHCFLDATILSTDEIEELRAAGCEMGGVDKMHNI
jgi:uncharacterized protein YjbI with pentapeptide repeats